FIGAAVLRIKAKKLSHIAPFLVSLAAGALFGDVFFHMIPELVEEYGWPLWVSGVVLLGIIFHFMVEKYIHRRHCHVPVSTHHVHSFAWMNLVGDFIHNFIDGLIIAASFIISPAVGRATTIAVVLHEIPQEIADFGVLIHGGFSAKKALMLNFLTALGAVLGAIIGLSLGEANEMMHGVLVAFAIGGFLYIAGSDLLPEIHKETHPTRSAFQLSIFILGIVLMVFLTFLETSH
ncbi:MAG TPA: ZIP family metal transporter, partial [Candidatus Absconditabacterales bacterium]|nr:ZIP family metal transporter [Candidatus Absconditabacterales bacterium]